MKRDSWDQPKNKVKLVMGIKKTGLVMGYHASERM